jgi:hypothetical protein
MHLKIFVFSVYDSSAKLPSGILRGNVNQLGDFDQCLSVAAQENPSIVGKYCLASVDVHATALNSTDIDTLVPAVDLAQAYGFVRSSYRDVSFMSGTPDGCLRREKSADKVFGLKVEILFGGSRFIK